MSVALKRVSSLTAGKTFTGWQNSSKANNGNMCSTKTGQAIETGIDGSGNVYVRFGASVAAVILSAATYSDPVTITTISTTALDYCNASISLIDNKLYLVIARFDTGENRLVCSLWRDDTGLGDSFSYISKIGNIADVGRTSFVVKTPGCTPLIKLSNGNLACGLNVYQPVLLGYWKLFISVSADGGATWSTPVGGANGSWTASEFASRSIWEVYPGLIVGNTSGTSSGYIALWSSYGAVYEGAAALFSGGTDTMSGIVMFTLDDGYLYLASNYYTTRRYKGSYPPTLTSLTTLTNWDFYSYDFDGNLGRSVITDPAGKILWCYNVTKYGGIFPGILEKRVRNSHHLVDETWERSKKGRYMASEGVWKRVIV